MDYVLDILNLIRLSTVGVVLGCRAGFIGMGNALSLYSRTRLGDRQGYNSDQHPSNFTLLCCVEEGAVPWEENV